MCPCFSTIAGETSYLYSNLSLKNRGQMSLKIASGQTNNVELQSFPGILQKQCPQQNNPTKKPSQILVRLPILVLNTHTRK